MRARPVLSQPDAASEGWSLQGWYAPAEAADSLGGRRREFEIALRRHRVAGADGAPSNGFALTLVANAGEHDKRRATSQVDRVLLAASTEYRGELERRLPWKAFAAEVRRRGVPIGIEASDAEVHFRPDPLEVRWGALELAVEGATLKVAFDESRGKRVIGRLSLAPAPLAMARADGSGVQAYPRLPLAGESDGQAVVGEAWLDHWSDGETWTQAMGAEGPPARWEWLDVSLEDGSDWAIVSRANDDPSRAARAGWVRRGADGATTTGGGALERVRYWTGPRSRVRHPSAWRVTVENDTGVALEIEAEAEGGEVPVFGLARAAWSGAVRASGSAGGRAVAGRGWGWAVGHGYVHDVRQYLAERAAEVDRRIEEFLPRTIREANLLAYAGPPVWQYEPVSYTKVLAEPVWDLISRDGKRWRPLFAGLLMAAMGKDPAPFESLLFVPPELFHSGALIVDDIQDASALRRGQEAIHLRYGVDVAINAANTMYFLPSALISRHPRLSDAQRLSLHEITSRQFIRGHLGQSLDLYWSRNMTAANLAAWLQDSLAPKILQMYAMKTGALLEGLTDFVCELSGAEAATREAALDFARGLGVAFQLVDDVHNFSETPRWRKVRGEDLADGKLTYAILLALQSLPPAESERLRAILCSASLRNSPAALAEGIGLVCQSGALEQCRRESLAILQPRWETLASRLPCSMPKIELRMLCEGLIELDL